MERIHIRRFLDNAHGNQGEIEPESRAWRLVLDREGSPQLWIRTNLREADGSTRHGYVCVDDLLPVGMGSVADVMKSEFGDEPTPEDAHEAEEYWAERWAKQAGKRCEPALDDAPPAR